MPIDAYVKQLFKREAKAFLVICYPLRCDVIHRILQHLLVPYIRLNQVLETAHILSVAVKLQRAKSKYTNLQQNQWCSFH